MKVFAMILVVLGVCVGALGASGYHRPIGTDAEREVTHEEGALTLFVAGATSLLVGGFLVRQTRRAGQGGGHAHDEKRQVLEKLTDIRDVVAELDRRKDTVDSETTRDRVAHLLAEDYFDLTSRSEDITLLLGFDAYARVWDGVATAERLLARCWSMCTDGYPQEGLAELPLARTALDRAVEALRAETGVPAASRG